MSDNYGEELIIEPLPIRTESKERKNLEEIKDGYARIIDRLNNKVKKPLEGLRIMI